MKCALCEAYTFGIHTEIGTRANLQFRLAHLPRTTVVPWYRGMGWKTTTPGSTQTEGVENFGEFRFTTLAELARRHKADSCDEGNRSVCVTQKGVLLAQALQYAVPQFTEFTIQEMFASKGRQ